MEQIIKLQYETKNPTHISFQNSDGKMWTVPLKNMKVALCVYEPSGIKGKIIKKVLPFLSEYATLLPKVNAKTCSLYHAADLKDLLDNIFGEDWDVSVFWGTPGTDKKTTIQISRDDVILGYCKIGNSERINNLFLHEKQILDSLANAKISNVPRCLGCYKIGDYCLLAQSTKKQNEYCAAGKFSKQHHEFLYRIYEATNKQCLFSETDYFQEWQLMRQKCNLLDAADQQIVNRAIELIDSSYSGIVVKWGMQHRDFTPWNMCVTSEGLFVFDFEYALMTAPRNNDYWHYIIQSFFYEEKLSERDILKKLNVTDDNRLDIVLYLVDIIGLYLQRGNKADLDIVKSRINLLQGVIEGRGENESKRK